MDSSFDLTISPAAYQWTKRFMRFLRRVLKVNIKLHHDAGQIEAGSIFVFNHFARFETFIPQYLFYEQHGVYCRSVADRELFKPDDSFSNFLLTVGAVPNNHPQLLSFLAAESLRGRKLIVFPEGGMVKDRQVLDGSGRYSIYSRSAAKRRKQHSGAAVIALALEVFKQAVQLAAERGDEQRLSSWCELLGFSDHVELLAVAEQPTLIIPASITFYPMRVRGNPLLSGVELFNKGISPRMREELLIEGNILFKNTDMDIRLGTPIRAANFWSERERRMVSVRAQRLSALEEAFTTHAERADKRLMANASRLQVEKLRDTYMHAIYQLVTVNLSHLAALIIYELLDAGRNVIIANDLHRILYRAVKNLQNQSGVHLHRSLLNPEAYEQTLQGQCEGIQQFLRTTTYSDLIEYAEGYYRFLPKLLQEHEFDQIRVENPVEVYANEVAPIRPVLDAVADAINDLPNLSEQRLAELRFDDEIRSLHWDKQHFTKPEHEIINALQTQLEDPEPFFFRPANAAKVGVVLVHGFLASPAEVRGFAEQLSQQGYSVLGVRLKGHGTSPWDLRSRRWQDWLASVRRGYEILQPFAERICLLGFSTGGSLCLQLAAQQPAQLAGVIAISAPVRFMNKNMIFVPLVHSTNRLAEVVGTDGIMPFRPNDPENPHINYVHMPVRALYELSRLVDEVKKRLADVQCPTLIIQGDQDPVIDPQSAVLLHKGLQNCDRKVLMIATDRHGILYNDIGATRSASLEFLAQLNGESKNHA